jgi:DNA polymerase-3 subunit beta
MRFNRANLLGALTRVMPAVGRDVNRPVLTCVLIDVRPGVISVECTNQEQHLRCLIEGDSTEEFKVLVSASRLAEILKRSDCAQVEFIIEDKVLAVAAGGARFELPLQDCAAFPSCEDLEGVEVRIEGEELTRAIASTSYAAAKDLARFTMMGVFISGQNNTLDFVATDGRRLAKATKQAEFAGVISAVVPASAWRMAGNFTGLVRLVFSKRGMTLSTNDGFKMKTLLVEGKYPDYQAVIPKDAGTAWRGFAPAELARAVRQAQVMVDRESLRLDVQLGATGPAGAAMVLGGRSATAGSSQITAFFAGEGKAHVSLNPVFLLEALEAFDEEEEVVFQTRGNGPVTLSAGKIYTLIMPQT